MFAAYGLCCETSSSSTMPCALNCSNVSSRSTAFGQKQSPVDFDDRFIEFDGDLRRNPITIKYSPETDLQITNTGSSVQANVNQRSTICGGPLTDTYVLEQFHLHWGSHDGHGSEHTLEGTSYSAELHLVHWNRDRYSSFQEAAVSQNGLAVLGIFLDVSELEHPGFKLVTDRLRDVLNPQDQINLADTFNPKCLLPDNTVDLWTYPGSLTTPPYSETVTWVVFREPIRVSFNQLESLRSLRCSDQTKEHIVDNYRPTCPIGERTIASSFHPSPSEQ